MLSFSVLPSAPTNSLRNYNNSPKQAQFTANAPEPDSDISQPVHVGMSPGENNVDSEEQTPTTSLFNPLSFDQLNQTERDQSEQQKAIEKQVYQEAIKAYRERAEEIRATAENIRNQGVGEDKEAKDLLQITLENNKVIYDNLTSYRRTRAHSQHYSQFSSYPVSADSQAEKDMRVALYNPAMTAYIRQKLFFSTISSIGHMVTV